MPGFGGAHQSLDAIHRVAGRHARGFVNVE